MTGQDKENEVPEDELKLGSPGKPQPNPYTGEGEVAQDNDDDD